MAQMRTELRHATPERAAYEQAQAACDAAWAWASELLQAESTAFTAWITAFETLGMTAPETQARRATLAEARAASMAAFRARDVAEARECELATTAAIAETTARMAELTLATTSGQEA